MNLEDKIREAFKKSEKARSGKWDSETQPNLYELDNFLRKSGYRLIDVLVSEIGKSPELVIEAVKPGFLYPEISHDITTNTFYIKTVDLGMIGISDIESILIAYENALGVLRHLESLDLKKLEIGEDE